MAPINHARKLPAHARYTVTFDNNDSKQAGGFNAFCAVSCPWTDH